MSFGIKCIKHDWGSYNFNDSPVIYKTINVVPSTGIQTAERADQITVSVSGSRIIIGNKPDDLLCKVYNTQGVLVVSTRNSIIDNMPQGIYVVTVGGKTYKVVVKD